MSQAAESIHKRNMDIGIKKSLLAVVNPRLTHLVDEAGSRTSLQAISAARRPPSSEKYRSVRQHYCELRFPTLNYVFLSGRV